MEIIQNLIEALRNKGKFLTLYKIIRNLIFFPLHQQGDQFTVLPLRLACGNTQNKMLVFKYHIFPIIYSQNSRQGVPESTRIALGEVSSNSAGIMLLPRRGCRGWGQPGALGGPAASLENWKQRWKGCQRAATAERGLICNGKRGKDTWAGRWRKESPCGILDYPRIGINVGSAARCCLIFAQYFSLPLS